MMGFLGGGSMIIVQQLMMICALLVSYCRGRKGLCFTAELLRAGGSLTWQPTSIAIIYASGLTAHSIFLMAHRLVSFRFVLCIDDLCTLASYYRLYHLNVGI